MKRFSYLVVFVVILVFLTAPVAFGQALDGKWFQLKISFKGYAFGGPSGLDKISGSTTNYLNLVWNPGTSSYDYTIYTSDGTPLTQSQDTAFSPDILEYAETVRDVGMTFGRDDTNYIDAYHTSLIKIKRDSQGALKSATFTSLGCEVYDGEAEGNTAFGGCTIKGKTIVAPPFSL
jgi:hypothetical protein